MASGTATTKRSNSVRPAVNAAIARDIDKAAAAMPTAIKARATARASENAKPAASIMDAATTATPSVIATAVPARTRAIAPATMLAASSSAPDTLTITSAANTTARAPAKIIAASWAAAAPIMIDAARTVITSDAAPDNTAKLIPTAALSALPMIPTVMPIACSSKPAADVNTLAETDAAVLNMVATACTAVAIIVPAADTRADATVRDIENTVVTIPFTAVFTADTAAIIGAAIIPYAEKRIVITASAVLSTIATIAAATAETTTAASKRATTSAI